MKAYPLIYGRTKNFDFVPDFLVRPADLDFVTAQKYVKDIMRDIDFTKDIRYSAFSVGDYCICGGISCLTSQMMNMLKAKSILTEAIILNELSDYLKDRVGRNHAFFIGIAIPKSEIKSNCIPEVPLEKYWDIYFEYLKHQWNATENTVSEKLELPPLEIDEKLCLNPEAPVTKTFETKKAILQSTFAANEQKILDYYFHEIMAGRDVSLITSIDKRQAWDSMIFQTAAVSQDLFTALEQNPVSQPQTKTLLKNTTAAKDSGEVLIAHTPDDTPRRTGFGAGNSEYSGSRTSGNGDYGSQKKTAGFGLGIKIIAAAVAALVLFLLFRFLK